jgi:hypothetical protein
MNKNDPAIVSSWMGIDYMRSRGGKQRQTERTKERARIFGVAVKVAKSLRELLKPVFPFPFSKRDIADFNTAVLKWLHAIQHEGEQGLKYLEGYQFNKATSLHERFHIALEVTQPKKGQFQLQIPAFIPTVAIAQKAHATEVHLKVMAVSAGIKGYKPIDCFYTSIVIPYSDTEVPAQIIPLPIRKPANSLALIVVALNYITCSNGRKRTVAVKEFKPCGVVGGMC